MKAMMKWTERLPVLGQLSILIALLSISGCSEAPKEKPLSLVPAIKVADAAALAQSPFPGRAEAGQEVNLSFRVSGPMIDLPVAVGDQVTAGQIVANIDPQDYINAVGTASGQLERARAAAERAEADYRRILNVYKEDPGATSETAVDRAKAARDSSRATVNSLTSALRTAEDRLNYTSLQAPFSGEVVATYVENFETVIAKQPILRVLDPSSIEFVIFVPETLIGYVPYVESIMVSFDALSGVEVPATIKEVGREASAATRTYPVTLVMAQPEGVEILPGMAGSAVVAARLPESSQQIGLEVPATAVFSTDNTPKSYVWVIDESTKKLSRREVTLGRLSAKGVLVKSGITAGEWVVVRGVHSVREGQQVRISDFSGKGPSS
ncbi:efflux RND transporter periplasmic adaptor subunit [Aestuariirhabdus sp. Z084]|uniref:efflux RND transporter periplasmic adaptor subunit n=1 Tax=Aestuariirhabdus haliotis TaxID=2918751 RepID=UPI00201B3B65|nr:efflux RND transporter periplasmic adaptor subunit [Aestuariirhabdus haliotis]MCL6417058.1 efflux RND transporter periplasmic adaptor subunit [Aestuariirhabdus haliotis]MCL6420969.1 efflux RND transporter periplasmic adaptor subunit [Aestuariirhabdus haliotis]